MQMAPVSASAVVSSGAGARCRYVKSTWPGRSRPTSEGCGSFTPRTRSACAKSSGASGATRAPCASYSASGMDEPSPAPDCTSTSCPCSASSRAPAGVSATRYSSTLVSVGTPTLTIQLRSVHSSHKLPSPQRQPELDPVARARQVAPRQLLDPPDPVAQRVPVAEQLARRALPLAVLVDEDLERAQELVAVVAAAVLERAEHAVAEEAQRVVVLKREQQLERAEVAVRRDMRAGVAVRR